MKESTEEAFPVGEGEGEKRRSAGADSRCFLVETFDGWESVLEKSEDSLISFSTSSRSQNDKSSKSSGRKKGLGGMKGLDQMKCLDELTCLDKINDEDYSDDEGLLEKRRGTLRRKDEEEISQHRINYTVMVANRESTRCLQALKKVLESLHIHSPLINDIPKSEADSQASAVTTPDNPRTMSLSKARGSLPVSTTQPPIIWRQTSYNLPSDKKLTLSQSFEALVNKKSPMVVPASSPSALSSVDSASSSSYFSSSSSTTTPVTEQPDLLKTASSPLGDPVAIVKDETYTIRHNPQNDSSFPSSSVDNPPPQTTSVESSSL